MSNELIIIDKIGQKLQNPKSERNVFPLSPTHRKELRELKRNNVGELRSRLRTIKNLKQDEYLEKYYKDVEKEVLKQSDKIKILNEDWEKIKIKINKIIQERIKLEEKHKSDFINFNYSYTSVSELKEFKEKRVASQNIKSTTNEILSKQFNEKYNDKFEEVGKIIHDMNTKYEEAINFGDLDIVRELYYTMKGSEEFFKKISEMKI